MNTIFKTTALALATSTLLLAGCGGGSSNNDSGASQVASKGKVIDFYLRNANVAFEGCDKSTNTNENGDFNIDDPACRGKNITVTGGTDIGTGLQNTVTLHALKVPRNDSDTVIVSPLTTLIYHTGNIATTAQIAQQLGLDANLLVVDPMTNAKLLKTTLVAQQLIIQTQAALTELGVANEATASEAVAKAMAMQMVESIKNGASTSELASTAFIQDVIETSVMNAKTSLSTDLQANIDKVAKNAAAVTAALIADEVEKVANLNITVVEGNPAATLAALKAGGQTDVVKEATQSEAAANAIDVVADLLTTADPAKMEALGDALASEDRAAIEDAAGDLSLPQSVIDDLVDIENYQDYIQLVNATFNGTSFDLNRILNSNASNPLVVNGFKTIQLNMVQRGQAPQSGVQQAKVGLSYTINGTNTLNIVVNDVELRFNTTGKLLSATLPKTSYSVNTYGKATLSFTGENLTSDALTVTPDGLLNLSVDEFLNKAANKNSAFKAVINDYTPKATNTLDIDVSLNLRVGIDANGTPANDTPVNAGNVNMIGKGVSAQLKIQ